ncbi:MAG TPA: SPFH/Band 7/PHB domain protein [Candidatus Egerieicola faecale]|uniref:SPFH/Band 7/PHB domain protein n=1 Tax=Candidatus Egerieicola faecale TaxID=2840774 RepID=A0A9D1IQK4_9FIRM|nr:SPFH/Band 7/PHB domain protein [Candidatus Egerieicola faecale]
MEPALIVLIVVLILLLIIALSCIRIVSHKTCQIIEFLGKYQTTWESGLHFKIPLLQKVVMKVSLKEQVGDYPPQAIITKDNVSLMIDTVVYYRVFDAKKFCYGVENPWFALENLTATTLRNFCGKKDLDEALISRNEINANMEAELDQATNAWGIDITRVEVKDITPPTDVLTAIEKQLKAEREKRASILLAEGQKQSAITRAEGEKQAKVLAAQAEKEAQIEIATGKAESIRIVSQAEADAIDRISSANITKEYVALKQLETLTDVGNGQATKLILPTELASSAAGLNYAGEMLGIQSIPPAQPKKPEPAQKPAAKLKKPVTEDTTDLSE